MPSETELPVLIDRITQALEEASIIAAADDGLSVIRDCVHALYPSSAGLAQLETSASMPLWSDLLRTTAWWDRHTRLRSACVQLLRTVGAKVDWAAADEPTASVLCAAAWALASALGALIHSDVADILSSKPPEQQASFFRQWRRQQAVVCQLLHAIADAPDSVISPQDLQPHEGIGGQPYAIFAGGPLLLCLNRQALVIGVYLGYKVVPHEKTEHINSSHNSNTRSGSSSSGSSNSARGNDSSSRGGGGSKRSSISGFVTCEQAYRECVELSESLVRLVVKLPRLQAALPPTSPFAHRPVLTAFDLPNIMSNAAQDWGKEQLTPDAAHRQLPAVLHNAATVIKGLLAAATRAVSVSRYISGGIAILGANLMGAMGLVGQVLKEHPHVREGKGHLTRYLRTTGMLVFGCIPALQQGLSVSGIDCGLFDPKLMFTLTVKWLQTLEATGLMDEAVRGGLGPLLKTAFLAIEEEKCHNEAALLLRECTGLCAAPQTASLALAIGSQGLLEAAVNICLGITLEENRRSEKWELVLAAAGALLRTVCSVLDSRGGTSLAADHADLLSGFDEVQFDRPGVNDCPTSVALSSYYTTPSTWALMLGFLVSAVKTASLDQLAAAEAGEEAGMDAVFRDVSMSPWTCTNPGCTNLAGCSEGQLHFMACSSCKEARYCCKECQKSDWQRHKVACRILKKSKA